MTLVREHGIVSVAFPSISTGAYGYPIEQAAPVALRAVAEELERSPDVTDVRFVLFSDNDLAVYSRARDALVGG